MRRYYVHLTDGSIHIYWGKNSEAVRRGAELDGLRVASVELAPCQ